MDTKHERWVLLGLPSGWAAVWLILHLLRPAAFPWLGIVAGVVITIPLVIASRIERRNAAGTAEQQREDRHEEHTRH